MPFIKHRDVETWKHASDDVINVTPIGVCVLITLNFQLLLKIHVTNVHDQ